MVSYPETSIDPFFTVNDLIFFCADPSSVELNIDGSTDKCSKGEDINFIFTGFTLSGKVSFVPFNSLFTQHGEFKSCMTFLCMITLRKKKRVALFFFIIQDQQCNWPTLSR